MTVTELAQDIYFALGRNSFETGDGGYDGGNQWTSSLNQSPILEIIGNIAAYCASTIVGYLMNLSNNMTAVSAMTSVNMLSSWGKVHHFKPHSPFSESVTQFFYLGRGYMACLYQRNILYY